MAHRSAAVAQMCGRQGCMNVTGARAVQVIRHEVIVRYRPVASPTSHRTQCDGSQRLACRDARVEHGARGWPRSRSCSRRIGAAAPRGSYCLRATMPGRVGGCQCRPQVRGAGMTHRRNPSWPNYDKLTARRDVERIGTNRAHWSRAQEKSRNVPPCRTNRRARGARGFPCRM